MNKQEKEDEKRFRYIKFDCEMRAKAVESAVSLPSSKNLKSLLENASKISDFIFGIPEQAKDKK